MNYTTLVASSTTAGSIANWLNSSTLESAAPTILEEAESMIYRRLRHWEMIVEATGTLSISSDALTLPSDYLEDKILMITGTNYAKITRKTIQEVNMSYGYDSNGDRVNQKPRIFYNTASQFKFDSPCDVAYPYKLVYYGQPAALSGSNTTNFLTSMYPRMVRCACMVGASEFMKDAGAGAYDRTYWVGEVTKEIEIAKMESDRAEHTLEVGAILQ